MKRETFHAVNPKTGDWYHVDGNFRVWTCGCIEGKQVSLCLTLDDSLLKQGELRELDRQVAIKRKELGLKRGDPITS